MYYFLYLPGSSWKQFCMWSIFQPVFKNNLLHFPKHILRRSFFLSSLSFRMFSSTFCHSEIHQNFWAPRATPAVLCTVMDWFPFYISAVISVGFGKQGRQICKLRAWAKSSSLLSDDINLHHFHPWKVRRKVLPWFVFAVSSQARSST